MLNMLHLYGSASSKNLQPLYVKVTRAMTRTIVVF